MKKTQVFILFNEDSLPKRWKHKVLEYCKSMTEQGILESPEKLKFQIAKDDHGHQLHPIRQSERFKHKKGGRKRLTPAKRKRAGQGHHRKSRKQSHEEVILRSDDTFVHSAASIFADVLESDNNHHFDEVPGQDVAVYRSQVAELEQKNQDLTQRLQDQEVEVHSLKGILHGANSEVHELKKILLDNQSAMNTSFQNDQKELLKAKELIANKMAETIVLRSQVEDFRNQVESLKAHSQNTEPSASSTSDLITQQKEFKIFMKESKAQQNEYLKRIQVLQSEQQIILQKLSSATELKDKLELLLHGKSKELSQQSEIANRLQQKILELEAQISNYLSKERQSNEQSSVNYAHAVRELEIEARKTKNALDFAESEILNMHKKVGAKDDEIKGMKTAIKGFAQAMKRLTSEISHFGNQ